MAITFDPQIFKAYDLRGVYPTTINEPAAELIGQAYVEFIRSFNHQPELKIVVGRDMRLSSPALKESLVKGLVKAGATVIDVGLVSTTTFYFAVAYYGYDGGIQITASHNPPSDNGMKMTREAAKPISENSGLQTIRDLAVAGQFTPAAQPGKVIHQENVLADLIKVQSTEFTASDIKPLKIVADPANGMASLDIAALMATLPVELIKINFELDGSFPNHQADPLKPENLLQLKAAVKEHHADLGIAADGDGDRYFFVDEQGELVPQEIMRGLMAQIELKKSPGATICYDIRPGKITSDMIIEAGGKPVVTKVGHSLIKETMIEHDSVFSGESSGHFFYRLAYGSFEAPLVETGKFLVFLSQQGKPVSELIKPFKKYFHSGEINSEVADKQAVMDKIAQVYADGEISQLDGVSVTYPDYWFNVRPSNTEPLLRLNLEAITLEIMAAKRDEVLKLIRG